MVFPSLFLCVSFIVALAFVWFCVEFHGWLCLRVVCVCVVALFGWAFFVCVGWVLLFLCLRLVCMAVTVVSCLWGWVGGCVVPFFVCVCVDLLSVFTCRLSWACFCF